MNENLAPLALQDIFDYLKTLNNENPNFAPFRVFSALVTNEEYNPEEFSQEIEDSEEDKTSETINLLKTFSYSVSELERTSNSEQWLNNHTKICPLKRDFNIIGTCQAVTKFVDKDGRKVPFRTFDCESIRNKLANYYNDLVSKGLEIFKIV